MSYLDFGIAKNVKVRPAEILGSGLQHQRLDFDDRLALHPGIDGHRARRHSRPAADHQD